MMFNGLPVLPDSHCPASNLFFLNEDYIHLFAHKEEDMRFEPFAKPVRKNRQKAVTSKNDSPALNSRISGKAETLIPRSTDRMSRIVTRRTQDVDGPKSLGHVFNMKRYAGLAGIKNGKKQGIKSLCDNNSKSERKNCKNLLDGSIWLIQ